MRLNIASLQSTAAAARTWLDRGVAITRTAVDAVVTEVRDSALAKLLGVARRATVGETIALVGAAPKIVTEAAQAAAEAAKGAAELELTRANLDAAIAREQARVAAAAREALKTAAEVRRAQADLDTHTPKTIDALKEILREQIAAASALTEEFLRTTADGPKSDGDDPEMA